MATTVTGDAGLVLSEISGGYAANSDEGQQWKFTYSGLWEDILETAQSLERDAEFSEAGISGYIQGWDAQTKDGGFGELEITIGDKTEEEEETDDETSDSDESDTDTDTDTDTNTDDSSSDPIIPDPGEEEVGDGETEDGGEYYYDSDGTAWSVTVSMSVSSEEISLLEYDNFWKGTANASDEERRAKTWTLACTGANILAAGEQSDRLAAWKALGEKLGLSVSSYASIADFFNQSQRSRELLGRILSGNTTVQQPTIVVTIEATSTSGSASVSSLYEPGDTVSSLGAHGVTASAPTNWIWEIVGDAYTESSAQDSLGEVTHSLTHSTSARLVKDTTSSS